MSVPKTVSALVLPGLVLLAAACASSSTSHSAGTPGPAGSAPSVDSALTGSAAPQGSAPQGSAPQGSPPGGSAPQGSATPAGTFGTKPVVMVPAGPPPTTLMSTDLIVGTGPAAMAGQTVSVQYVGVSYSTKKQFDASWDRGQAFDFPLGGGQVIKGWDQGVVGMKVGGRRELVIPPGLAYGEQSPSPDIKPNETLVFVIDLVKIS